MRRKTPDPSEGPGQDSFLDIVANLVGILIILIMVIGARATDAMVEVVPADQQELDEPPVDVDAAKAAAQAVEQDIRDLDLKIKRQDLEIAFRRKERDKFLQLATALEESLQQRRGQLSEEQQRQLKADRDGWRREANSKIWRPVAGLSNKRCRRNK